MITGAPPTFSIAGNTSCFLRTNAVDGIPMSWRLSACRARSLSRETLIAWEGFSE